jgi:hypothetical protein
MGDVPVGGPAWNLHRRPSRWRAWAAFVIVGALLGSAHATGFATTGGGNGTTGGDPHGLLAPSDDESAAVLAERVSPGSDIRWNWVGREGSVESTVMYTVDLDTLPPTDRYFTSVALVNAPSGFTELQLEFRLAEAGTGGSCTTDALGGSGGADSRVMTFDSADAQVTFSVLVGGNRGLPGGTTYCVGINDYAGAGSDPGGTYIRRESAGPNFTGTLPHFVSTLERATSG